jgi:hypothetical protein
VFEGTTTSVLGAWALATRPGRAMMAAANTRAPTIATTFDDGTAPTSIRIQNPQELKK